MAEITQIFRFNEIQCYFILESIERTALCRSLMLPFARNSLAHGKLTSYLKISAFKEFNGCGKIPQ